MNSRQASFTMSPARTLAASLALVLLLITVGAATQSVTLGVILFLSAPALLVINVRTAWAHRRRSTRARTAPPAVTPRPLAVTHRAPLALPAASQPERVFVAPAATPAAEPRVVEVQREWTDDEIEKFLHFHYTEVLGSADGRKLWRKLLRESAKVKS